MDTSICQYIPTDIKTIERFFQRKAWCGSDGLYVPSWMKGSFAWRIESEDSREFIEGGGIVPGPVEAQCSFRSEVCGVIGIVHVITHLETLTNPAPILLTGCNSLTTLYQCVAPQYSVKARWNHCDLLSHLQALIYANETNHAWMHVPAHQIRKKPASHFYRNALLNKEMNALASRIMEA